MHISQLVICCMLGRSALLCCKFKPDGHFTSCDMLMTLWCSCACILAWYMTHSCHDLDALLVAAAATVYGPPQQALMSWQMCKYGSQSGVPTQAGLKLCCWSRSLSAPQQTRRVGISQSASLMAGSFSGSLPWCQMTTRTPLRTSASMLHSCTTLCALP